MPRPRLSAPAAAVAVAAVVAVALLAGYAVLWIGVSAPRQAGSDFSVDYVAAQLVRDGRGGDLYNQQVESQHHAALLPAGTVFDLPYIGPPTAALLTIPLTVVSAPTAYRAWAAAQLAMLVGAAWLASRTFTAVGGKLPRMDRSVVVLLAVACPATLVLLLMGQWDGLLALALAAAAAALAARRPGTAGFVLGLAFAAAKPHLALGLAAFLVARGSWRAVAGAAVGVITVVATSVAAFGPGVVGGFAGALGGAFSNTSPQSTVGLAGLVSSWLGSGPVTAVLVAAGSLAALASCAVLGRASRGPDRLAPALAGATALSLLLAPHLLAHDLAVLVPAMVWFTTWYARHHDGQILAPLAGWVAFSCMVAVDAGNGAMAPPGRLVPWGLALFGVFALRNAARSGATNRGQALLPLSSQVRPRQAS